MFSSRKQPQTTEIEENFAMTDDTVKDSEEVSENQVPDGKSDTDSDISFTSDSEEEKWKRGPSTEMIIAIRNQETGEDETFLALLDTGTSSSLGISAVIKKLGLRKRRNARVHQYQTAIGSFDTHEWATIRSHKLIELSGRRKLSKCRVQVTQSLGRYDFIFGRDYMARYGIDVCFSDQTIRWDGTKMEMHSQGYWTKDMVDERVRQIGEPDNCDEVTKVNQEAETTSQVEDVFLEELYDSFCEEYGHENYLQAIMDAKYERQDADEVVQEQKHLSADQKAQLKQLLLKHQKLFEGTLGEVPDIEIDVELKPDAEPYHCRRPYRTPHLHREVLRKEIMRLCDIGVLAPSDGQSPWCAPGFCNRKKDGTIRIITDYRKLNAQLNRKPWPIPHVMDLIQDIGHYTYAMALDLSMGYYHCKLSKECSDLTTFMLDIGCFKYLRMPMGMNTSSDEFQKMMTQLFSDYSFVHTFMDDILITSDGSYEDHLKKVTQALERLETKNLQVNMRKSFWAVKTVEYLGFILTPDGVKPQPKKVDKMLAIEAPKNRRQLRHFIGLVNFYRYMWKRRSHLLEPLTRLTSTKGQFKWTEEQQKAFDELKKIVARETMLYFPDYSKPFDLYTDASDLQLGAVVMQDGHPIAFFSRKLTSYQRNYGVGQKEMLCIVEALKEFRTMLLGYTIKIHTDHLNLTYDKLSSNAQIMRWRLMIEEFLPTLEYVEGEKNVVADALSRLPTIETTESFLIDECFDLPRDYYAPVSFKQLEQEQQNDASLKKLQDENPGRIGELYEDIGRKSGAAKILTLKSPTDGMDRILVPESLRKKLVVWYHRMLVHPGSTRLYNTLHQHFIWPKMLETITEVIRPCKPCQVGKRGERGYGKIPLKDIETAPWKDVCLDLSGPWTTTIDGKEVAFHALTIIDPFTSWIEIIPIRDKTGQHVTDLFEQEWLRRYPRPGRCIYDQGSEFQNEDFYKLCAKWNILLEPITTANPQANAIVERVHRIMGDMIRVQLVQQHKQDDPIRDMFTAAAYGIRATVHGTTLFTPGQIVFNKDMILRTNILINTELVRQR